MSQLAQTASPWTDSKESRLLALRALGLGWGKIADQLHIPVKACEGRWKAIQRASGLPTTRTSQTPRDTSDGPPEAVRTGKGRGEEFETIATGPKKADRAFQRTPGLKWLLNKGRLTRDQYDAGMSYGLSYQASATEAPLKSCLNQEVGGSGQLVTAIKDQADWRANHRMLLTRSRAFLHFHVGMIYACDMICGQEKTPREVYPDRDKAERIEAELRLALDLLVIMYGKREAA